MLAAFEGFRGLAVLGIIAYHLLVPSGLLARIPDLPAGEVIAGAMPRGIDLILIISGFVMFMPTVVRGGRFGDVPAYAVRRAARILPTYYLTLVMILLVLALDPALTQSMPGLGEIVAHFTLVQSPVVLADSQMLIGFGLDGALWTISALACFYVLLPLIAGSYYRHPFLLLALAAAITILWRAEFDTILGSENVLLDAPLRAVPQVMYWAFHFGIGMTAAWIYMRIRDRPGIERSAVVLQVAALVALAAVVVVWGRTDVSANLLVDLGSVGWSPAITLLFPTLAAILLVATSLAPIRAQLGFGSPLARFAGEASYGAYMIHLPITEVLRSAEILPAAGSIPGYALWLAVVVPLSFLFGHLAFTRIEVPIRLRARAWAQRRSRGGKADPAPPAPAPGW